MLSYHLLYLECLADIKRELNNSHYRKYNMHQIPQIPKRLFKPVYCYIVVLMVRGGILPANVCLDMLSGCASKG